MQLANRHINRKQSESDGEGGESLNGMLICKFDF